MVLLLNLKVNKEKQRFFFFNLDNILHEKENAVFFFKFTRQRAIVLKTGMGGNFIKPRQTLNNVSKDLETVYLLSSQQDTLYYILYYI